MIIVIATFAFWKKKKSFESNLFSPGHLKYLISMTFFDHTVLFTSKGKKALFFLQKLYSSFSPFTVDYLPAINSIMYTLTLETTYTNGLQEDSPSC